MSGQDSYLKLIGLGISLSVCYRICTSLKSLKVGPIRMKFKSIYVQNLPGVLEVLSQFKNIKIEQALEVDGPYELCDDSFDFVYKFCVHLNNDRPKPMIKSVYNFKGGVGKTTISAGILKCCKVKQMVVDLDPQCSLTQLFKPRFYDENTPLGDVIEVLEKESKSEDDLEVGMRKYFSRDHINIDHTINMNKCFDPIDIGMNLLICGSFDADGYLEKNMSNRDLLVGLCKDMCEQYKIYSVTFDLNPGRSELNTAVLEVSDLVLIPTTPDYYSFSSVKLLTKKILPKIMEFNKNLRVKYIINRVKKYGGITSNQKAFVERFNFPIMIPELNTQLSGKDPKFLSDITDNDKREMIELCFKKIDELTMNI